MSVCKGDKQPEIDPKKVRCGCGRSFGDEKALSQHKMSGKHSTPSDEQSSFKITIQPSDRSPNGQSTSPLSAVAQVSTEATSLLGTKHSNPVQTKEQSTPSAKTSSKHGKPRSQADRRSSTRPTSSTKANASKAHPSHKQYLSPSAERYQPKICQVDPPAEVSAVQVKVESINQLLSELSLERGSGSKQVKQTNHHQKPPRGPKSQVDVSSLATPNQPPAPKTTSTTNTQPSLKSPLPTPNHITNPKPPNPTSQYKPTPPSTPTYHPRLWKDTITFVRGSNLSTISNPSSSPQPTIHASSGGTSGFTDCYPLKLNPLTRRMMDMTTKENFSACTRRCGMCGHCRDLVCDDYRRYVAD